MIYVFQHLVQLLAVHKIEQLLGMFRALNQPILQFFRVITELAFLQYLKYTIAILLRYSPVQFGSLHQLVLLIIKETEQHLLIRSHLALCQVIFVPPITFPKGK